MLDCASGGGFPGGGRGCRAGCDDGAEPAAACGVAERNLLAAVAVTTPVETAPADSDGCPADEGGCPAGGGSGCPVGFGCTAGGGCGCAADGDGAEPAAPCGGCAAGRNLPSRASRQRATTSGSPRGCLAAGKGFSAGGGGGGSCPAGGWGAEPAAPCGRRAVAARRPVEAAVFGSEDGTSSELSSLSMRGISLGPASKPSRSATETLPSPFAPSATKASRARPQLSGSRSLVREAGGN